MKHAIFSPLSGRAVRRTPRRMLQSVETTGALAPACHLRNAGTCAPSLADETKTITMNQPDQPVPLTRVTGIDDPSLYVREFVARATYFLDLIGKQVGAIFKRLHQLARTLRSAIPVALRMAKNALRPRSLQNGLVWFLILL